jgi:hypothetical protein
MLYLSILLRVWSKGTGVAYLRSNPAVSFRKNKSWTVFSGYSHVVDEAQGNLTSFVLYRVRSVFSVFLTCFSLFRRPKWWIQDFITSKIDRCADIDLFEICCLKIITSKSFRHAWLPLSLLCFICETIIPITRLTEIRYKSL